LSRHTLCAFLAITWVFVGCSPSPQQSIDGCNDESAKAVVTLIPDSEIAKQHIRDQEQGFFFRCMKRAGFKSSQKHLDETAALVRGAYPGVESKIFFEKLNEITRQNMRDAKSGYWEK
jgi:hypothetical protein